MQDEIEFKEFDGKLPNELLTSFAKSLVPEIRSFYHSEQGQAYYKDWLEKHPEYEE